MNIISLRFMRGCGCHYSSGTSDCPQEFSIAKHRVLVQTHFIKSIKDKHAYKKCSGIAGTPVGRTKCYEQSQESCHRINCMYCNCRSVCAGFLGIREISASYCETTMHSQLSQEFLNLKTGCVEVILLLTVQQQGVMYCLQ